MNHTLNNTFKHASFSFLPPSKKHLLFWIAFWRKNTFDTENSIHFSRFWKNMGISIPSEVRNRKRVQTKKAKNNVKYDKHDLEVPLLQGTMPWQHCHVSCLVDMEKKARLLNNWFTEVDTVSLAGPWDPVNFYLTSDLTPGKLTAGTCKSPNWKGTSSEPKLHFRVQPFTFPGCISSRGTNVFFSFISVYPSVHPTTV